MGLLRNILVKACVWIIIPLCGAEFVLRVTDAAVLNRGHFVLDKTLGWRLKPNSEFLFEEEGRAHVSVNSLGFRDLEHVSTDNLDSFRVVLLGDSFLEAKQVEFRDSLPALLQVALEKCVKGPVEVLNFAVQGYGTVQQYEVYRTIAEKYNPQAVVLAFYEGNDVFDNHPNLNPSNPELAPYLVRAEAQGSSSELRISTRDSNLLFFVRNVLHSLAQHSVVAAKLFSLLAEYTRPPASISTPAYEWALFRSPFSDDLEEAWLDTERVLTALRERVSSQGRTFRLMSIPAAIVVHPEPIVQNDFKRRNGVASFDYAFDRIARQLPKEELVPLTEVFQEYVDTSGKSVYGFPNSRPGFGHFNQVGHKLAADALARRLCVKN